MKKKKRKSTILVIILLLLSAGCFASFFVYSNHLEEVQKVLEEQQRKLTIKDVESHYSNVVSVKNEAKLYDKDNKEIGSIGGNQLINLTDANNKIDEKTKYFYIDELDAYISYKDVIPYNEEVKVEDVRYKGYLLFDENVVIKENAKLYSRDKSTFIYSFNKKLDLPIIVKDDDGVFVEYLDKLIFVNKNDIESTYNKQNNDKTEASSVPVTCYHFIYLPGDTSCNEIICHSKEQIESHFTYLKENNYFSINTTELRLFIEGKLRLPKNSILITIDDGARAENFIPILEQYGLNATLFLVSSWYPKETFQSSKLEIASHTHDLHTGGKCPGGQGGWIKCLEHDKLLQDFKTSRETLDGTEAFCYPFYEYNDYSIRVLKEAGFKMGFAGGQQQAKKGIDLFKIPRITIMSDTSLNEYINYVK